MSNGVLDPRLKQIKIKSGVLKRVVKEKSTYEKELTTEVARLEKMKHDNKDAYDLKKQEEVINETIQMVPHCEKRILTAFNELKNMLEDCEYDLGESEEYKKAKEEMDLLGITPMDV